MKQSDLRFHLPFRSEPALSIPSPLEFVRRMVLAVAILATGLVTLRAHPGHPVGQEGFGHVVTSPYHLAVLAVFGLLLALGARVIQRRSSRNLVRACGIFTVVLSGVLWVAR